MPRRTAKVARTARIAGFIKARSKARARARAGRRCSVCREPIAAERSTKRYCSGKCRVYAHRDRNSDSGKLRPGRDRHCLINL